MFINLIIFNVIVFQKTFYCIFVDINQIKSNAVILFHFILLLLHVQGDQQRWRFSR